MRTYLGQLLEWQMRLRCRNPYSASKEPPTRAMGQRKLLSSDLGGGGCLGRQELSHRLCLTSIGAARSALVESAFCCLCKSRVAISFGQCYADDDWEARRRLEMLEANKAAMEWQLEEGEMGGQRVVERWKAAPRRKAWEEAFFGGAAPTRRMCGD
jgi:hypothetical protein